MDQTLDYQNKVSEKVNISAGGKITFSDLDNDANVYQHWDGDRIRDLNFSTRDFVTERIYALYTSVNTKLHPKWQLESGIRYEQNDYSLTSELTEDFNQKLRSFFPVVRINHKIDTTSSIQVAYNRRITRPEYTQLASYFVFGDPSTVATGNPQLRPAFINTIRASYQHRSVTMSLEANYEKNAIYSRNFVNKEKAYQNNFSVNYDSYRIYNAMVSFPLHLASWWDAHITAIRQWRKVHDVIGREYAFSLNKGNWMGQMSQSFVLSKKINANLSGLYLSRFLQGDQLRGDLYAMNAGIQIKFSSGSSLNLAFNDILNSSLYVPWDFEQAEIQVHTFGYIAMSERQMRLTYNTNFGNDKVKSQRVRKTASEEERSRVKN